MVAPRVKGADTIIDHITRYRFTTLDVLHRLFYADVSLHAVRKAVKRLSFDGKPLLETAHISRRVHLIHLCGGRKIKPTTVWTRYALLHFCCSQDEERTRLTEADFYRFIGTDRVPGVDPNNQHYYIVSGGAPRLGVALVDFRSASPFPPPGYSRCGGRDLAQKICERWSVLEATPYLRELHAQGLTVVSAIVATQEKAQDIHQAMKQECRAHPEIRMGAYEVHVVSQMLDFNS